MPTTRVGALERDIAYYEKQMRDRETLISDKPFESTMLIDAQIADQMVLDGMKEEYRQLTGRVYVGESRRAVSHTRRRPYFGGFY